MKAEAMQEARQIRLSTLPNISAGTTRTGVIFTAT